MFSIRQFLARVLLVTLLATLGTPVFSGEMSNTEVGNSAVSVHHMGEDECPGCAEHDDDTSLNCCLDEVLALHCCTATPLAHLMGTPPADFALPQTTGTQHPPEFIKARFSSLVLEGLDRPPKSSAS